MLNLIPNPTQNICLVKHFHRTIILSASMIPKNLTHMCVCVCVCVFVCLLVISWERAVNDGVGVGTKMKKLKASHFKGSSAPTWAQKPSCACQGKMLLVKALALASWLRLTSHRALLWIGKMAHCLPRGLHGFWLMPRLGKSNCHGSWLNVA